MRHGIGFVVGDDAVAVVVVEVVVVVVVAVVNVGGGSVDSSFLGRLRGRCTSHTSSMNLRFDIFFLDGLADSAPTSSPGDESDFWLSETNENDLCMQTQENKIGKIFKFLRDKCTTLKSH